MQFCILEPELLCRLVFVKDVELDGAQPATISPPHPPTGTTELPSCPVCLERLDEHVSGVVTTVCNHKFHNDCLRRWGDTSCPVCRYCQHPEESTSHCAACGTSADLWICLICGHVGCGRYKGSHAASHWQETGHGYSLELETQRVWDYASDAYVHRLIRSKTDGKLVELPAPDGPGGASATPPVGCSARGGGRRGGGGNGHGGVDDYGSDCGHMEPDMEEALVLSKLDALATEYNHLLVTQLESQRQHFEALLVRQRQEMDAAVEGVHAQATEAKAAAATAAHSAHEAEKRKHQLESKLVDMNTRLGKVQEERDFLKQLNDTLLSNQREYAAQLKAAQEKIAGKEAEISELQEQVRDIMVFLEARQTIAAAGEGGELAGATVMPVPEQPTKGKKGGKGRKK